MQYQAHPLRISGRHEPNPRLLCANQVMPHIIYHSEEALLDTLENRHRQKREPVAMTLALLLGLGGTAVGIGPGTAPLIQGNQQLSQLQLAIDTDLRAVENSISLLEKSLTSLSEVVLQNRRGLDLLFLKDKGSPRRKMLFLCQPCWNS